MAMEAERVMSSYELLVQLPMRPAVSWLGHPFSLIASANCVGVDAMAPSGAVQRL